MRMDRVILYHLLFLLELIFLKFYLLNVLSVSGSNDTNGNSNLTDLVTNNNLGAESAGVKMKRQSSLQSSSSPPAVSRDRTQGSEADAAMTSLSGQCLHHMM